MADNKGYSQTSGKQPQKFIPRKDLFPDDLYPVPNKTKAGGENAISLPRQSLKPVVSSLPYSVDTIGIMMLLIGLILIVPKLTKTGTTSSTDGTATITTTITNVINSPRTLEMLKAISPYLEDTQQEMVHTISGVMEGIKLAKDIRDHTYHHRLQSMAVQVPIDPIAKKIEMIKVLKPYFPESHSHTMDKVVRVYDVAERLSKNIKIYKNNKILSENKRTGTIETINEIFKVIRPIIPSEYTDKADKVMQIMKMAEAMELTGTLGKKQKKESPINKNNGNSERESVNNTNNNSTDSMDKTAQMLDSLKTMLNDEQKESMDMILKMAQLLAQPSEN